MNKCVYCQQKFATDERLITHYETRHPRGATWAHHGLTVWKNFDTDGAYTVICDKHHFCVSVDSLRVAKSVRYVDFCDVCNGHVRWCRTCDMEETFPCEGKGHDIVDEKVTVAS